MSRISKAAERLAAALESLEQAVSVRPDRQGPDPRLGVLEAERETLVQRIAALEEELVSLSGMTAEVEGRLDGAIGEIRAALARQ